MNLIHEKTESLLKTFLEQIKPKPLSWRLISIEFQDCETLHSPLFHNLCEKNLHALFGETECKIYWDKPSGFILIFFQGRAMPIEKCVENFLKETEFKGFGRFFDILDLSIDWDNMTTLLNRIYAPKQKAPAIDISKKFAERPESISEQSGFIIELSKEQIKNLSAVRKTRERPLLLLVEDDPFTLQLVKLAFKEKYDVITAETARQALVYYQRHLPDMVFLDIQLPDGNGINLLQQMTNADDQCYPVMLSSHSHKEKILECHGYGSKGFIAKPFTRQRLLDATEKFISIRKPALTGNLHGT